MCLGENCALLRAGWQVGREEIDGLSSNEDDESQKGENGRKEGSPHYGLNEGFQAVCD